MNNRKCLKLLTVSGIIAFTGATTALYGAEDRDRPCKKPKFRTFEPVHLSEVPPETEISFHVSNGADPETIKATARKISMPVTVVDKMNFFVATAKLPASLINKYARIHVEAKADDGDCIGQDGWLLKILPKESAARMSNESDNAGKVVKE